MSPDSGTLLDQRLTSLRVTFIRSLLPLFLCWITGALGTRFLRQARLESSSSSLKPFLEQSLPSLSLPENIFNKTIQLMSPSGERIDGSGPQQDLRPPLPTPLPRSSVSWQEDGLLLTLVPLRTEEGLLAAYSLTFTPFSLWEPVIAYRTGLLFIIVLLVRKLTSRHRRRLSRERDELLNELRDFSGQQMDVPLKVPLGNPYKPVVDTINQLTTSRDRQDRTLTEQHHRQQVLLSNMSEGILVLDTDLRISGVNPVAARWLDMGNPLRLQGDLLYNHCRVPQLLSLVDDLTSTGSPKELYTRLERPNADDRILKVRASPLIDKDQTLGVLILLQDVTTLRRLETLRQDFVANVSHELRTPLASIKGYAELMLDDEACPEDYRKYLSRTLKQSDRMINIIEDLLSLTRIESAESNPSLLATEIRPVLENCIQLCEEQAQLRSIEVAIDCAEDLRAEIHPPLLEQAIHNLTYNAVKYTHPKSHITLRAEQREDLIWIEVEDQGPGIPESAQPRLFERFYRVDKARSRAVGGTGLGLSIAKHIAQLHQGDIGVTSKPGEGSTFWIRLPALRESSPIAQTN